jgi:hypothetical protein
VAANVQTQTFRYGTATRYQLATAAKLRDVRRRRIWISLKRCHVLIDSLERGPRYPAEHCRYNKLDLSDAGIFADFEKHGTKDADLVALEPSQKRQND